MSENSENTTDRVIAYVDGYNLYYSVRNKWTKPQEENPQLLKYHLKNLVLHCLKEKGKETNAKDLKINFYTAPPLPSQSKQETNNRSLSIKDYKKWTNRQKKLEAKIIPGVYQTRKNNRELQTDVKLAVKVLLDEIGEDGYSKNFLKKLSTKIIERIRMDKHEEKQTDVNISVGMLSGAFEEDGYDKAVLISNDTDFCGLILKCLELKKYVLVLGTERYIEKELCDEGPHSSECKKYMNDGKLAFYRIKKGDIEEHLDWDYINPPRTVINNKKNSNG